ncbi:MAG: C4-dicarboxylate ABC transporter permease [Deltaproteobacteria bacterium RBG_13_47_9]|nr:MAG: C4-dicarboxylate ABC transporter permease [Deltaproteobacteria bacterium RBG_13_47_9]
MSSEFIGTIGIIVMVVLMFLRMPIAFTMALVGFVGFTYLTSLSGSLFLLSNGFYFQFTSYTMLVVPLFVLMGEIAFHAGISKRIYDTAYAWLGFIPGGLAVATIGACAGFAAICGSSAATAATMGTVALPEMKKFNYDKAFATGTVAAGGTLGILIPPSIVLIVYGIQTELSIGKLFIAGILPGIVLSALFIACILMMCFMKPELGLPAPKTTLKHKIKSLPGTIEMFLLFFLVIGGLMLGWFTPTEAAGIGAAGAILIALVRRNISWEKFKMALLGTTRTSAMVLLIIACAMIFSRFLTVSGLPQALAKWVGDLNASPYVVLGCVMIIYIIGGCFMDALSFLIITINIFFPMIVEAGFDPIWFGVIIVILLETGAVTPPVGINVYVIKGIAPDVELYTIFKGILPFLIMMFVGLGILTLFPDIALVLPRLMK